MSNWRNNTIFAIVLLSLSALLVAVSYDRKPSIDEAKAAGLDASHFRMADENYFKDMDGGVELSREEIVGRNMWMVWTGGNDRFWDEFSRLTFGGFDLLKIVASNDKNAREERWSKYGLVNEPCFKPASGPAPDRFGLWLDVRDPSCAPDPFADATKYPGVEIGARGTREQLPVGSYYGEPTGIVGLRLFPNPDFNADAEKAWKEAEPYYCSPEEARGGKPDPACREDSSKLIRPYRVGMSCAFCHAGPSPVRPPQDPAKPRWSNLGSIVGAQFMNIREVFLPTLDDRSFLSQILLTYKRGVLDTSLVPADSINNPRTMNAIYALGARMDVALRLGEEKLAGGALENVQLSDFIKDGPLTKSFKPPDTVYAPHILKDGADSVGPLAALNRVYVNVGMFSEEWLKHFNPVIGGSRVSPFEIHQARANSSYWQATEANTVNIAKYFLRIGQPDLLKETEVGKPIIDAEAATAERGKTVFATTCARCHSSKGPQQVPDSIRTCRSSKDHLTCFKAWWNWTKTDDYKRQMTEVVLKPDFAVGNYFSSDVRVPVTLLRTNACSAVAPNAIAGGVWDNFSSQAYKQLPPVGSVSVRDPFTGARGTFELPGGGRGYIRPPSLISVWATAPFLLNNSLGTTAESPSVEHRLKAFDEAVEQLLKPEKRWKDTILGDKGVGYIDRTTQQSRIFIPARYVPSTFDWLPKKWLHKYYKEFFSDNGDITLGPLPKDLPAGLIANTRVTLSWELVAQLPWLIPALDKGITLVQGDPNDKKDRLYDHYASLAPDILKLSNCKDFEVNRGHYFGTAQFNDTEGLTDDEKAFLPEPVLSDDDKRALIAYLKTL